MKKILSFACFILLIGVATSCTKKEYYDNDGGNDNKTIIFTTTANSWVTSDNGINYATTLQVPEIDSYFNAHGGVLIYVSADGGQNYDQVPEVFQGVSYSYQHAQGIIILGAQAYNSTAAISNPGNLTIKVVLVDSN